jgi:hypothetical protein
MATIIKATNGPDIGIELNPGPIDPLGAGPVVVKTLSVSDTEGSSYF